MISPIRRRLNALSLLPVLLLLTAIPPANAPAAPARHLTITLLHDNDLHGHLFSYAYTEIGRSPLEQPSRGGAARRATLVRDLRRSIPNPVMLVDTGDIATRGPLATTYEGIADVEAMNAVGYDLAAIGNNEFKLKDGADRQDAPGAQADLLQVVKRSRFPWICANVTDSRGALLEGVQPYVVRDIDGVRVGFLGLTAPRPSSYPETKGWTFIDPVAAAKQWIPQARRHCDILIAMTHLGVDDDKLLAAQTAGLDAIIGGDSHTFLYKPIVVTNAAGLDVPIVQDGEFGADLGRFDLNLTCDEAGQWRLASYKDELLPVGPKLAEAPDVKAALAPFLLPFQTVVGHIDRIPDTPALRLKQTVQILTDALRKQTGADLALNPGKIDDAGLYEVFRHPAVTRYDIYAVLPFHDAAAIAAMTGAQIQTLLTNRTDTIISGNAAHLDPTRTYRVALVDYIAGSVYKIDGAKIQTTGRDIRDIVISYLHDSLEQQKQR